MRKRTRVYMLALWMLIAGAAATGCGGKDFLEEKPEEYALTQQTVSQEESPEVSEEEPEEPSVSFLMEEVYPFARDSLDDAGRLWYDDMERILGGFGEKAELNAEGIGLGLGEEDIDRVFQCVLSDHPELFYVEGYSYTKYSRAGELMAIEFSGSYSMDVETALQRKQEIETAASKIQGGIDRSASDYEKIKYVYETLIRTTDYDLNAEDNQNIYSVFVHHLSVCQGYAKATQYLLNRLGVECTLVLGTVDTGEGHAWNLVKADGSYYYVDTTWGDVSYRMEDVPDTEEGGIVMPEINYDYLNVTTEEILRTHTIGGEVPMPYCDALDANYYVREGAYFTSYDREQMEALFRGAVAEGKSDVTVKCSDEACYREVVAGLIDGQEIFGYLEEGEGTVAYAQNEKQLSLTFWVTNG